MLHMQIKRCAEKFDIGDMYHECGMSVKLKFIITI
jgi:hypothetical protein